MKFINFSFVLLLSVFFSFGCAKEGPIGPAGPEGAVGPVGPQGPAGQNGSANVKTTIAEVTWTQHSNISYRAVVNDPNITQEIMDAGVVSIAMSGNKDRWLQMPFSNSVIGFYTWSDLGSVTITSVNLTANPFDTQYLYKYIKISTIKGE